MHIIDIKDEMTKETFSKRRKKMTIRVIDCIGDRATDMKQGDQIYDLIIDGFHKGEVVHVDFAGMKTILSTFLNNAVGTLYKDYTSEYLNKNLKIDNLCDDDLFILRRVAQRAKDFYSNPQLITKVLDTEYCEKAKKYVDYKH